MSRKTMGAEFLNTLDGTPIDLLLEKPIVKNSLVQKATKTKKIKTHPVNEKLPLAQTSQIKERITVQISKNTIERVKDCVYWNRLTVAQFVEEALEAALSVSEQQNGKPYVRRRSELKPGRPTK